MKHINIKNPSKVKNCIDCGEEYMARRSDRCPECREAKLRADRIAANQRRRDELKANGRSARGRRIENNSKHGPRIDQAAANQLLMRGWGVNADWTRDELERVA